MNLTELLTEHHFPSEIIKTYQDSGIENLNPPQADAIKKGILRNKSVVVAAPTASGKTLIAELLMLKSALKDNGRCLYIAPLKALASEKYYDFKKKFEPLGIKVGIALGDLDSPLQNLNRYQILIATAEKVDSMLRSRSQGMITSLKVVVIDEIHFVNDESRGPTLEILITRIKQLNPTVQFLGLSATISNSDEIAGWLGAELVASPWRPIPLREGVYYNERILFDNHAVRLVREETTDDVGKLVLDTLRGKGQVLVFVNSRRSAQAASRLLSEDVLSVVSKDEKAKLYHLADELANGPDATKVCKKLGDAVRCGVAFHHAGLRPRQRQLIEDNFKLNLIKVICSTPTLAAGVNLPARRAIIRDCKRYASGLGSVYIPTSEYKQCAGRAGRPQYDDHGEAILMAKSLSESHTLFEKYIHAKPEPITSKLGHEASLRIHILSSIAAGYVQDINGTFDFLNHTFLSYQKLCPNLLDLISTIFEFLQEKGFIEKSGFRYFTTPLGNYTSRLYIDPLTAITLKDGFQKIQKGKSFSSLGLLHMINCCPDSEILSVGKADYEDLNEFATKCEDEFILTQGECPMLEDMYSFMAVLKTTWMLLHWIEEEKEDAICDKFNIGPGDIYRHVESAQWLLYAASMIAQLLHYKQLTFTIENLRRRIQYGIKEELLDLASLKGIGRIRARQLYRHGYKKVSDLKTASATELAVIKQIGKSLARDILSQVKSKTSSSQDKPDLEEDLSMSGQWPSPGGQ